MSGGACAKVVINSAAATAADRYLRCVAAFERLEDLAALNDGDRTKAGEIDKRITASLERACDEYDLLNGAIAERSEAP